MAKPSPLRRFRSNPIEVVIFAVFTLTFAKSLHSLFYDQQNIVVATSNSLKTAPSPEARVPASTVPSFVNVDVSCESNPDQETQALKVRLTGPLCGTQPTKTSIANTANKFVATVFTDTNTGKFSTDYIPLNSGKNPIQVEFTYRDGKTAAHEITINKN